MELTEHFVWYVLTNKSDIEKVNDKFSNSLKCSDFIDPYIVLKNQLSVVSF